MTTTPLMGLVLPTDHGSFDVWGPILETVFGIVDSHNHTTGRGGKVPTGGLNIDADLSFSPSGTPRAITDLKALDFSSVASSSVTGLAGAFFVSDGTGGLVNGELYWRTVLGSNVQVTLGAALNVAAFGGGIGGDYISASALLSYDAATLSYWLQQPGAPRPWARIRVGDVDIYETAASIVNRVRLQSPAALAASYALTLPTGLPASRATLKVSSAGAITATVLDTRTFPIAMATPIGGGSPGGTFISSAGTGILMALGTTTGDNSLPLILNVGEVITSWTVNIQKTSATGTITAKLYDQTNSTTVGVQVGATQTNGAVSPGNITLGQSGLSTTVVSGHAYQILVFGGGTTGDFIIGYQVVVS